MEHGYAIPAAETRVELRIVNSRFIGSAAYTPSVEEAKGFIARVRHEFADATHNVHAFVVGYGASVTLGATDDGEPAGTAGRPVLAVLQGSGLGDLTMVVTRYFGGTLLGTGGLVRAYGDTARALLAALPRAEKVEWRELLLNTPYSLYERVRQLAEAHQGQICAEEFAVDVTVTLRFPAARVAAFRAAIGEASAGLVTIAE
jgi:uncharacterized YigZ family protein